ncbi:MAG: deoxyguanosinetriphosphate triphosphohydrolase [Planctomycetes bacterium]|nr:deoxyguanosinetriphosphate triphosphohydrolase [Planctomycetota bacterium]MCB9903151.1 deoxyguanosinetriphosphate triphosphohydrolase [Planctomycetota bacterium]
MTSSKNADRPWVDRQAKEAREDRELAPYALKSATSRGRRFSEPADPLRTVWERDRDRIVHCTAFRRLMYKTQVFINRQGDHQRTRLSHSLEVAQVARSVGNALGLNEPLCEGLALAHDIGHPPFGHRGEAALDRLMEPFGGFRHNAQVLRVVDLLERRSPDYSGLNLTREFRESLLKHESSRDWPEEFGEKPRHPWLEAQVVDLADSTAYNAHDVEDGLAYELFDEDDIHESVTLWRDCAEEVRGRHPGFLEDTLDRNLRVKRVSNQLIKVCINDLMHASRARITESGIDTPEEVRESRGLLIGHGAELREQVAELQSFLWKRVYRHPLLQRFSEYADEILSGLFAAYRSTPGEMPGWYRRWADAVGLERAVCDYLAGMTDRFAEREWERLGEKHT